MAPALDHWNYREVWLVDFEFNGAPGEIPSPVCLVAHELRTDRVVRLWRDQMGQHPPYAIDDRALFVAFFASAELGCHLALNWPLPGRVLDLYAEFRCLTNAPHVRLRSLSPPQSNLAAITATIVRNTPLRSGHSHLQPVQFLCSVCAPFLRSLIAPTDASLF